MLYTYIKIITIGAGALTILLILIQQRGASLGAGFGASSELVTTRRGTDKTLHDLTILTVIIFVLTLLIGIIKG
ncbi:MAG TPA: preprotein translocase subunit SecG [Candidatus Saccharimonadales bacterium]|nr:preprotein translocase subunit SecG [Candidatus Saccharimonadales bacterium]